jgi:hypothetical protein
MMPLSFDPRELIQHDTRTSHLPLWKINDINEVIEAFLCSNSKGSNEHGTSTNNPTDTYFLGFSKSKQLTRPSAAPIYGRVNEVLKPYLLERCINGEIGSLTLIQRELETALYCRDSVGISSFCVAVFPRETTWESLGLVVKDVRDKEYEQQVKFSKK